MHAQELFASAKRKLLAGGYLRDAFARILQAARTSLRLKFKTAKTSLRLDI